MQIPNYGNAAPVAKFFLLIRSLQLFVFILLTGIIADYISTISSSSTGKPFVSSHAPPPMKPLLENE